jgi:hypothetical protein
MPRSVHGLDAVPEWPSPGVRALADELERPTFLLIAADR